jgi:hypothetical protein
MHYPFYAIDEEPRKETCPQAAFFTSPLRENIRNQDRFRFNQAK